MSILALIGKKINKIYEKAVEEGNTIKGYLLAFISGFIDGMMSYWAIFGVVYTIYLLIVWLLNKLKKEK